MCKNIKYICILCMCTHAHNHLVIAICTKSILAGAHLVYITWFGAEPFRSRPVPESTPGGARRLVGPGFGSFRISHPGATLLRCTIYTHEIQQQSGRLHEPFLAVWAARGHGGPSQVVGGSFAPTHHLRESLGSRGRPSRQKWLM